MSSGMSDLIGTAIKLAVALGVLLNVVPVMVWVERRGSALMQDRPGPNRLGPLGLFQALADALKYALYRTRNASRAEELAADALTAALDPERSPWNSAGPRTLSQHVVNLVHEALKAERAKRRVREDPVNALEVETRMRREVPRPDAALRARQKRGRGLERERRVREGLDPFAQRVLDVRFGEARLAADRLDDLREASRESVEHRGVLN